MAFYGDLYFASSRNHTHAQRSNGNAANDHGRNTLGAYLRYMYEHDTRHDTPVPLRARCDGHPFLSCVPVDLNCECGSPVGRTHARR